MSEPRYWIANCPSHGQVKIKQKTKPTACHEIIPVGTGYSTRECRNRLTDQQDVTARVLAALATKKA